VSETPGIRRAGAAGLIAAVLLLAVGVVPAMARTIYLADLTADAVTPGPGDANATGAAEVRIFPEDGQICWAIQVDGLSDPAIAASLHAGAPGAVGNAIITLGTPDADGMSEDCSGGHDPALLQSIVDDAPNHYVSIVSAAFPEGAVRGQLAGVEITGLSVAMIACPASVDGPEDVDPVTALPCTNVRGGTIAPPPDGYTWDPEPIGFDWNASVVTVDGSTYDIGDATLEGGGTCDPSTLTCRDFLIYEFGEVLAGETTVTQLSAPPGFEFGWARAFSRTEGEPDPVILGMDGTSIAFDSSGTDGVAVWLVEVVAGVAPTAAPSNGPRATPPATSTETLAGSETASPWSHGALALVVLSGLFGLSLAYVARRTRRPA